MAQAFEANLVGGTRFRALGNDGRLYRASDMTPAGCTAGDHILANHTYSAWSLDAALRFSRHYDVASALAEAEANVRAAHAVFSALTQSAGDDEDRPMAEEHLPVDGCSKELYKIVSDRLTVCATLADRARRVANDLVDAARTRMPVDIDRGIPA